MVGKLFDLRNHLIERDAALACAWALSAVHGWEAIGGRLLRRLDNFVG